MKKLLFTLFIFQLTFAQTRVTSSGISVQGIARNSDNTVLESASNIDIDIKFYTIENNAKDYIISKSGIIRTDDFGVFSYVVDIDESDYSLFQNFDVYIEISRESAIYVDEKLLTVPYSVQSINARNGIQTGTIVYFTGSEVPPGWLLCDGSTFSDDQYHAPLKAILGSNTTPDLRAMFLRGTGTSSQTVSDITSQTIYYSAGDYVNSYHKDRLKSHKHIFNSLTGSPNDDQNTEHWGGDKVISPGGYEFQYFLQRVSESSMKSGGAMKVADGGTTGSIEKVSGWFSWGAADNANLPYVFGSSGSDYAITVDPHQHRVYGRTWIQPFSDPSDTSWAMPPTAKYDETAPVWYAVNYIIKI